MEEYELQPDTEERKERAAEALKVFKFIPIGESILLNDNDVDRSDASSEIQNPFSDDEEQSKDFSKLKKRMSRKEAAIFLMNSFTDGFKSIEKEIRKEMPAHDNLCTEDLHNFEIGPYKRTVDEEFERLVKEKINSFSKRVMGKPKKEVDKVPSNDLKKPKGKPAQVYDDDDELSKADTLSGVWRMLKGESVENGFPITEMGYNVLEDKRLDWLNREDIDWNDRELTKRKCEQWMNKCNL